MTLATLDPATVTMRSLVLVAGETAHLGRRAARGDPGRGMTVHLVGAGPGDPSLLTVAAAELIRRARVVVYDRPSMDAIVALAPAGAERHVVGLAPGRRALAQPEVNALLVELGHAHGDVVRLKSGDPFVASRGGEEALALQDGGHRRAGHPRRVVRAGRARRGRHPADAAAELGHGHVRRPATTMTSTPSRPTGTRSARSAGRS